MVTSRNRGHYMLSTNRHLRDVLTAKGYDFHFGEFAGAHHELSCQSELAKGTDLLFTDLDEWAGERHVATSSSG